MKFDDYSFNLGLLLSNKDLEKIEVPESFGKFVSYKVTLPRTDESEIEYIDMIPCKDAFVNLNMEIPQLMFEKSIENGLCIDPSKTSVKGASLYGLDWY